MAVVEINKIRPPWEWLLGEDTVELFMGGAAADTTVGKD